MEPSSTGMKLSIRNSTLHPIFFLVIIQHNNHWHCGSYQQLRVYKQLPTPFSVKSPSLFYLSHNTNFPSISHNNDIIQLGKTTLSSVYGGLPWLGSSWSRGRCETGLWGYADVLVSVNMSTLNTDMMVPRERRANETSWRWTKSTQRHHYSVCLHLSDNNNIHFQQNMYHWSQNVVVSPHRPYSRPYQSYFLPIPSI